jgi:hypothetical protein
VQSSPRNAPGIGDIAGGGRRGQMGPRHLAALALISLMAIVD